MHLLTKGETRPGRIKWAKLETNAWKMSPRMLVTTYGFATIWVAEPIDLSWHMMRSRVENLCYSIVASMFFANTAEKAPAEIDALAFAISRRSSNAEACHRINELESQLYTISIEKNSFQACIGTWGVIGCNTKWNLGGLLHPDVWSAMNLWLLRCSESILYPNNEPVVYLQKRPSNNWFQLGIETWWVAYIPTHSTLWAISNPYLQY